MPSRSTQAIRQAYARAMLAEAGVTDPALERAMAAVPREDFLGDPPWHVHGLGQGRPQETSDPHDIYRDVLVSLDAGKGLNNGSPSLHAAGLHALAARPGETVVHIGAGTGYYSAILAETVGPQGRVAAVEFDPEMAARAKHCLKPWPNVEPVEGNGADWPREPADILYVNFAVDRPADPWIERLKPGGRLLFPLGVPEEPMRVGGPSYSARAGYLLVTNTPDGYAARFLQAVSFVWNEAIPQADDDSHARLRQAMRRGGGAWSVRSLRWRTPPQPEEWYAQDAWGLSFDPPGTAR
ncbi:MAG: methyltransferase domain-containing protein [Hoeflea sp.]|uniref:protein-L-isoaspartate O-methyltransferase family protein n=1 Tax=Hoeflea sp. TaxID=1940281 RepID=UPI001DCA2066|nr:methyltransferase domain-containing protein [Hoeflea sp.]MBU4528402.1 methyltransferase domain-containing protein [Alphaproteobacteria bacterium]MBU4543071.1 methyltransferase domain-containing protein [Alphaproteobacteria bacterium]MBU4551762.1 methyltransferase domain-containing protein [Alphaproteobacteria bacterium]MBV1723657.1 methyltransferase domain-containing protein [Hoeflea sp.]MBV1761973.1 methyltransferase domain-containing protein [Hoeflea sp.]